MTHDNADDGTDTSANPDDRAEAEAAPTEAELNEIARGIVSLTTRVPEQALTASMLGTERSGYGVLIDNPRCPGLVLTIGYLVTEAESAWVSFSDGNSLSAHVVGYDQETGFGLLQLLGRTRAPTIKLGSSAGLREGSRVVVCGADEAVRADIVAIREFAGYWEYVLPDALFTMPAHPNWGGTALLDEAGHLAGIGSLLVQGSGEHGVNMCVPIDAIHPVLDDLLAHGRRSTPPRPWLGWLVQDSAEGLVVSGLYPHCPATEGGVREGDVVTRVNAQPVETLAELFRQVWATGPAGVDVTITTQRDGGERDVTVRSVDRNERLLGPTLH